MPHAFAYGVQDAESGNNFGHEEQSDGDEVQGSYNVQLSDGRKQIVS
ncbi:UNVERIFIED_CONTAM: hypothetical protein GTU68_032498 [Idotea baltica]|nr:hypothetical protein [Idotea baltica]